MTGESERDEADRYERLVQTVADPICTLDENGRFQYVNAAFETLSGHEASVAVGEPLEFVFPETGAARLRDALESLPRASGKLVTVIDASLETSSGSTVPVECRLTVLPPDDEDRAVLVIHDVSRLKRRERRLAKFASVVSHDLRNPLDVALGRVEMLPEIVDLDETTAAHLEDVQHSLERMERIIHDVLTLTRERDAPVETVPTEFTSVVRQAWETVDTDGATLSVEGALCIEADESRLQRLFENLFRNAVQHGGDGVTVRVEAEVVDGETVRVVLADDGPGIPDGKKPRVFEDGFSTEAEGTGLGLSIVREIARAHDWQISVADSTAGGARFEISGISLSSG